jgi:hypothetical protein
MHLSSRGCVLDAVQGDDCRAAAIAFATAEPLGATSGRNPAEFHDPTFRKSPWAMTLSPDGSTVAFNPYFHDGSAPSLTAVVEHYDKLFGLKLTAAQKSISSRT